MHSSVAVAVTRMENIIQTWNITNCIRIVHTITKSPMPSISAQWTVRTEKYTRSQVNALFVKWTWLKLVLNKWIDERFLAYSD